MRISTNMYNLQNDFAKPATSNEKKKTEHREEKAAEVTIDRHYQETMAVNKESQISSAASAKEFAARVREDILHDSKGALRAQGNISGEKAAGLLAE